MWLSNITYDMSCNAVNIRYTIAYQEPNASFRSMIRSSMIVKEIWMRISLHFSVTFQVRLNNPLLTHLVITSIWLHSCIRYHYPISYLECYKSQIWFVHFFKYTGSTTMLYLKFTCLIMGLIHLLVHFSSRSISIHSKSC